MKLAIELVISRANTRIALNPRFGWVFNGWRAGGQWRTICMLVCGHWPKIVITKSALQFFQSDIKACYLDSKEKCYSGIAKWRSFCVGKKNWIKKSRKDLYFDNFWQPLRTVYFLARKFHQPISGLLSDVMFWSEEWFNSRKMTGWVTIAASVERVTFISD